jgi:transcriptional repressor NrdR
MKCPRCDNDGVRVVDSREGVDGRSVRRRRECEKCEFRFTTFERIEESLPMIVKKGGQRESFDRYKVLSGMKRACEKRPVSIVDLEEAVKQIETNLLDSGEKEVSSEVIGEQVINTLKALDQVAYVRFASVYREFSDVKEFVDTLKQLNTDGKGKPVVKDKSNLSDLIETKECESLVDAEQDDSKGPIIRRSRSLPGGRELKLIES